MTRNLQKDILQWDIKSWGKAISFWEENVEWSNVANCLELGGREGGLSLWLALKGKKVVCSDLKNTSSTAKQLHEKHRVTSRITYQDIDATSIPYENYFDVVVFKSIIGGIGRNNNLQFQQKVFSEVYKALKPNGKLLFAENLIASLLHQKLRKQFVNWGNSWRYISLDEVKGFLKEFKSHELKTTGVLATFGRSEKQRHFLAEIDNLMLNRLCQKNWRYIVYGVATK